MRQVGQLPRIIAWCTVNKTLNSWTNYSTGCFCHLGRDSVQTGKSLSMFRWKILSQSSEHNSTVKMQAAVFLETLVMSYQAARRHTTQYVNFHEPCQENVKFYALFGYYKCLHTYALESVASVISLLLFDYLFIYFYLRISLKCHQEITENKLRQSKLT